MMTSRTGLIPAIVNKSEVKPKVLKPITKEKGIASVQVPSGNQLHRSVCLSNTNKRSRFETKPHVSASKSETGLTHTSASLATRGPSSAGSKSLKRPASSVSQEDAKRKSHPGFIRGGNPDSSRPITPGRRSLAVEKRTTPKSILKKELGTENAETVKFQPGINSGMKLLPDNAPSASKHVKFQTKSTAQASLRVKLNAWLEAKGKTPSRCRHLMCFDAEMSAKKRRSKLVDRTITQNLLSQQEKALQNEEVRKKLFESAEPVKAEAETAAKEKENVVQELEFTDTGSDQPTVNVLRDCSNMQPGESLIVPSPKPDISTDTGNISGEDIWNNLKTMLEECLTLFHAGCPLENILPWLKEMETHIPKALTFAPYYICKAKVVGAFPQMVLDVYCEAVRNNAQPSDLLATEMKTAFSHLLTSTPEINKSASRQDMSSSCSTPITDPESQCVDIGPSTPSSQCSTPNQPSASKKPRLGHDGSTIKYSITSTTPLLRWVEEAELWAHSYGWKFFFFVADYR